MRALLLLCCLIGASGAYPSTTASTGPATATYVFESPVKQHRFEALLLSFRCLVCQNQSLADSDATLALDLRAQIYEWLQAGWTDAEIRAALVARYGEFILYAPPLSPKTTLLWWGPLLLLGIAGGILLQVVRQAKKSKI